MPVRPGCRRRIAMESGMVERVDRVVVLRPGALGDVLVTRTLLAGLRRGLPEVELVFVAPGERGRLLVRENLAHCAFDWERSEFAWLFGGAGPPPPPLGDVFGAGSLVFAFLDLDGRSAERLGERLRAYFSVRETAVLPSRPGDGAGEYVGDWLAERAGRGCGYFRERFPDGFPTLSAAGESFLTFSEAPGIPRRLVIHPGSGSGRKNWPWGNFSELACLLLRDGRFGVGEVVVTAGEADGEVGERLAASIAGAVLMRDLPLSELGAVLSGAWLYVGNDSGVTHLAAASRCRDGGGPHVVAVFGPSDSRVWAPPGAGVLRAGEGMLGLTARDAYNSVCSRLLCEGQKTRLPSDLS